MIRKILKTIKLDEILDKNEIERELSLKKWSEEERHHNSFKRHEEGYEHEHPHGHHNELDSEHHHHHWTY